jgi:hypothetical protein
MDRKLARLQLMVVDYLFQKKPVFYFYFYQLESTADTGDQFEVTV